MADRDRKLYTQILRQIHQLVLERGLKAGDLLPPEQTLATEFHVSRNVVREAIKSMEVMGIVRAVAGRGTEILPFSMDYFLQAMLFFRVPGNEPAVRQMFDVRKNLEMSYMRQAFHALKKEDVVHLRQIVEKIRVSYEEEGLFAELDREFHMTLFRPLNNEVLESLLNAIWEVDVRFQMEKKRPHLAGSVAKHEAIVKALEEYDYFAFAKAMEYHFSSGKYTREDYMEDPEAK